MKGGTNLFLSGASLLSKYKQKEVCAPQKPSQHQHPNPLLHWDTTHKPGYAHTAHTSLNTHIPSSAVPGPNISVPLIILRQYFRHPPSRAAPSEISTSRPLCQALPSPYPALLSD